MCDINIRPCERASFQPLLKGCRSSVGRCAIFGFVFLGQKNLMMHIAHLVRTRVGWSMCDIRLCISCPAVWKGVVPARVKGVPFQSWSMCDIRLCISWPEKSQDAYRTSGTLSSVGRCAIFGFVFLGQKNHKMHISNLDRFRSVGREHGDNYGFWNCIHPKRRFWKDEQKWKSWFSKHFSRVSTRFGLRTIEQSVEKPDFSFVHPSKIVVWGA